MRGTKAKAIRQERWADMIDRVLKGIRLTDLNGGDFGPPTDTVFDLDQPQQRQVDELLYAAEAMLSPDIAPVAGHAPSYAFLVRGTDTKPLTRLKQVLPKGIELFRSGGADLVPIYGANGRALARYVGVLVGPVSA